MFLALMVLLAWYICHAFIYYLNGGSLGRDILLFPFQLFLEDVVLFSPFSTEKKIEWMKEKFEVGYNGKSCGKYETTWSLESIISPVLQNQKADMYYDSINRKYVLSLDDTALNYMYREYCYDRSKMLLGFYALMGCNAPYFWIVQFWFLGLFIVCLR